ncbi:hypothetical protein J6590_029752 [Homalodisca vitripennis]|nr:hypothetical protein J6590_029752 [Homalodisca vitripennis]
MKRLPRLGAARPLLCRDVVPPRDGNRFKQTVLSEFYISTCEICIDDAESESQEPCQEQLQSPGADEFPVSSEFIALSENIIDFRN